MIDLENVPMVCHTRPENADPDMPHCDGTCLILIRVPYADMPKMVTLTSISQAEVIDLKVSMDRELMKSWRRM